MPNNKIRPTRLISKGNKYFIYKDGKLIEVNKEQLDLIKKIGFSTNKITPKLPKAKVVKTFSKRVTNSNQTSKILDMQNQLAQLYLKLIKEPDDKKRSEDLKKLRKEQEETKKYIDEQFKRTNDLLTGKLKSIEPEKQPPNLIQGDQLNENEIIDLVENQNAINKLVENQNKEEQKVDAVKINENEYIVAPELKDIIIEGQENIKNLESENDKLKRIEYKNRETLMNFFNEYISTSGKDQYYLNNEGVNIVNKYSKNQEFRFKSKDGLLKYNKNALLANIKNYIKSLTSNEVNNFIKNEKNSILNKNNLVFNKIDSKATGLNEHRGDGIAIYQLDKVMLGLPYFLGVLTLSSIDAKLQEVKKYQSPIFSFIYFYENYLDNNINHYTAVFCDMINYKDLCYYDSYGNDIPQKLYEKLEKFIHTLELPYMLKFKENKIQNQSNTSDTCGIFSMFYIYMRYFGFSHKEASGYNNIEENEKRMLNARVNFGFV